MKRIIFLVGLVSIMSVVFAYGQEKSDIQNTAQSQEAIKTFAEPLEKRVEKAVTGIESYEKELQKELEPIKDSKEQEKMFFAKLQQYISRYVRNNSIRELLALEAKVIKKGEGPETTYGWLYVTIHNMVLKLAEYSPVSDIPINDKILEIVGDESVDDYVRSKYVIDIRGKITDLHNRRMDVGETIKEEIYPTLIKIIDDTSNNSELRAEAAATLVSMGRNNKEITKYVIRLFDDKDDLVKDRTMWYCDLENDEFRNRIIEILKNKDKYSKKIVEEAQIILAKYPEKTSEAIPYLLEMIKDVKSAEEFRRMAADLQEYNDPTVLEAIIQKLKELKLETDNTRFYLKNSLLLDYLAMAKEEDKLLILKLIYETDSQIIGNVYTPPHFGKTVAALKDYISCSDSVMQKKAMQIYGDMIEMAGSVASDLARREAGLQLGRIKEIIIDCKNKIKDPTVLVELDKLIAKIEKIESQSKEP